MQILLLLITVREYSERTFLYSFIKELITWNNEILFNFIHFATIINFFVKNKENLF